MPRTTRSALRGRCLCFMTFISRKSLSRSRRKGVFQISDSHDEKSGIILEEKRDVPLVHR
jgi:hypothetical protein